MIDKDDGGPAFPSEAPGNDFDGKPANVPLPGMSLRDYFAGQVLPAMIAICVHDDLGGGTLAPSVRDDVYPRYVAARAYKMADAMLAERVKL